MKKIVNRGFILLISVATVACHRPYALLQRTPTEQFNTKRSGEISIEKRNADSSGRQALADWPTDSLLLEATQPSLLASTAKELPNNTTSRVQHHLQAVRSLLTHEAASQSAMDQQPRPRPQTRKKGMTLREFLGLPEKRPKTAWERINWNIKAGGVLILIAVLFALLKITILAIIFGILAALILLRGMRKTWKRGGFLGL